MAYTIDGNAGEEDPVINGNSVVKLPVVLNMNPTALTIAQQASTNNSWTDAVAICVRLGHDFQDSPTDEQILADVTTVLNSPGKTLGLVMGNLPYDNVAAGQCTEETFAASGQTWAVTFATFHAVSPAARTVYVIVNNEPNFNGQTPTPAMWGVFWGLVRGACPNWTLVVVAYAPSAAMIARTPCQAGVLFDTTAPQAYGMDHGTSGSMGSIAPLLYMNWDWPALFVGPGSLAGSVPGTPDYTYSTYYRDLCACWFMWIVWAMRPASDSDPAPILILYVDRDDPNAVTFFQKLCYAVKYINTIYVVLRQIWTTPRLP